MNKKNKSVTLIELIISVIVVSIMILSFYYIDTFSRNQVLNSDRRAKVQNELAYALEHMSKYIQQARGDTNNRGIVLTGSDFQVHVYFNSLTDNAWVTYSLSGNTLTANCSGSASCPFGAETLSNRITVFNATPGDSGSSVEIDLVGLYKPTEAVSLRNPQVEIKSKLICNSCSAN